MADSSFLLQLEQRTEQVKITLANLEADRARIENMISQLQPIVPYYDALLDAERGLRDANVELDAMSGRGPGSQDTHGDVHDAEAAAREQEQAGLPSAEGAHSDASTDDASGTDGYDSHGGGASQEEQSAEPWNN